MKRNPALPLQVQFFLPIIEVLRKSGGSATPQELKASLVELLEISDAELADKLGNGDSRLDSRIIQSKGYAVRAGLLDVSDSNVWTLTENGLRQNLADADVLWIFRSLRGSGAV